MFRILYKEILTDKTIYSEKEYEYNTIDEALIAEDEILESIADYRGQTFSSFEIELQEFKDGEWRMWTDIYGNTSEDYCIINGKPMLIG